MDEFKSQSSNQLNNNGKNFKKKSRRTRRRVDAPKQTYLYAAQRREMELMGISTSKKQSKDGDEDGEEDEDDEASMSTSNQIRVQIGKDSPISIARQLGMDPSSQACDASFAWMKGEDDIDTDGPVPIDKPQILGEIRVGSSENESQTGMHAYIIEKPAGWAILEGNKKKGKKQRQQQETTNSKKRGGGSSSESKKGNHNSVSSKKKKNVKQLHYYNEETDKAEPWELDLDAFDLSSVMTGEELEEFEQEGGIDTFNYEGY